jgi:hypothetical protein
MYYLNNVKKAQRTKQSLSNTLQKNLSNRIRKHLQQIKTNKCIKGINEKIEMITTQHNNVKKFKN